MDEDGAELKGTICNTWHTKCVWFRIGFILHHITELLQLQEREKELFMVSQMHQKLELQNYVVWLKGLKCIKADSETKVKMLIYCKFGTKAVWQHNNPSL